MKSLALVCLFGTAVMLPPPRPAPAETAQEGVLIPDGSQLREDPDPDSPPLTLIDEEVHLVPLERVGDWVLVRWRGWRGWVSLREERKEGRDEPLSRKKEPTPDEKQPKRRPAGFYPSPEQIRKASDMARFLGRFTQIMQFPAQTRRFGMSFDLHTDVRNEHLLGSLEPTVASVGRIYQASLFLEKGRERGIWLFSRRAADTEFFREDLRRLGLVALSVADRDVLRARLVHELSHRLNHPLEIEVPWWLDEGLAESLSASTFAPDGALRLGTLTPQARQSVTKLLSAVSGGASLSLPAIRRERPVCAVGAEQTMDHPRAAMLARYLLVGPRRDGLKRLFRDAVFRGKPVRDRDVLSALGTDEGTLEREFTEWLIRQ